MTGGSLGLILMPQLASFLQERYSFRWATFLTGAIILHAPVVTLLLHPVSWHHRAPDQTPQKPLSPPTVNKDDAEKEKSLSQGLIRGSSVPADLLKLGGSLKLEEARPKRLRSGSECQDNFYWLEQRGSVYRLGGSTLMAGSVLTLQDNEVAEERHQEAAKPLNPLRRVWIKFRAQYNLRLMKDPLAVGTALATCLTMTSAVNVFAAIPFVLAEAHYSLQDTAMAMSVAAVVDLFTRMGGAMITDWPKLDVRILYAFGQLIYMTVPYGRLFGLCLWFIYIVTLS
ncbi:hypothetical protein GWK47_042311 [Chionoecetes opilio]|uniref:Monocarboxylate transporter n=1 Tax=Chionoecetes opilio TaxID=41210 RepID=A0A8J4Y988_CHIOP|nr:hypothetical protein GWK47_042311 [Chionoecetes opilio]